MALAFAKAESFKNKKMKLNYRNLFISYNNEGTVTH